MNAVVLSENLILGGRKSNVDLVKAAYAAFGEGDIPTVLGAMDRAVEWREAEGSPYQPSGEAWVEPQAILENLFMKLGTECEDFTVHTEKFHDAGSTVIIEGRYTGMFKATQNALDAQLSHLLTIRDGKIVGFQQYCDTGQWQSVMNAG